MAETGAPPEQTVMIGDSVYDMELARAANVRAIGVTWGYHDAADLLKAGAGALIHNYSELEAAIERVLE